MHGLISRSFEGFIKAAYSEDTWRQAMRRLDAGIDGFEAMFRYDKALLERVVDLCAELLDKEREVLLEDFGTFLVVSEASARVRRLLRFGGVDFEDFLHSLEDLSGRAALAVPDLDLPDMCLVEREEGRFELECALAFDGIGHVLMGLLRALADDYGALVFLDHIGRRDAAEVLSILLVTEDFADGRDFHLADVSIPVGD